MSRRLFLGYEECGELVGVMGIQNVQDVTLIRHAYVRSKNRGKGIGSELLLYLCKKADRPILIGTWADAVSPLFIATCITSLHRSFSLYYSTGQ